MALLVESGIPEDRLPDAMREATFGEKFQILELAARRYAGLEQERMFRGQPSMSDERRAGILKTAKSLMEEQRRIVGIVKQRLGIDGD